MQNFTLDKLLVAIDLGTSKVRGVVGVKSPGGLEIIASEEMNSGGIKRGCVMNLEEASFCIKSVLRLLQNRIDLLLKDEASEEDKKTYEITQVFVGLNGLTIKTLETRNARNPGEVEVTQSLIDELRKEIDNVKVENGEILDVIPQEYLVDDTEDDRPVGRICTKIEGRYKLIVGRPSLKSNLYKCFEKAGYKIAGIYLSPIATAESVLSSEEKELGSAVIDFGAGTTSLAIYHKKILRHVCVIPFGGALITKDIEDLKLTGEVAEKLKIRYGSTMECLVEDDSYVATPKIGEKEGKTVSIKFLAGIIEARMDDILNILCEQINLSGLANEIEELVITGRGARMTDLIEKLKMCTGKDVRFGIPNQKIGLNMEEKYLSMEYAQLIGILLQAKADTPCIVQLAAENKQEPSETIEVKKKKKSQRSLGDLFNSIFDKFEGALNEDSEI